MYPSRQSQRPIDQGEPAIIHGDNQPTSCSNLSHLIHLEFHTFEHKSILNALDGDLQSERSIKALFDRFFSDTARD